MATQAQVLANRRNAQKSTGPRTTRGKVAISKNAVRHGLFARDNVIRSEDRPEFALYRDRILTELAPDSPMESMLAERIVVLFWRLRRIGRIQTQSIDAMNEDNTTGPLAKLTQSLSFNVAGKSLSNAGGFNGELALGRIAIKDFSRARVLDRLLMYERRIENSLYKTILEFQKLNLIRKINTGSEMPFNQ